MTTKRKKDILAGFDPNKSDSEDENFDPTEDRPRRSKKPRTTRNNKNGSSGGGSRRRVRYRGSDIDDDDDEVLSDSVDGGSFIEDDDVEDAPVNASGRTARKAARVHKSYAEASDEEDELIHNSDDDAPKSKIKQQRIVVLKHPGVRGKASKEPAPPAGTTTRRTRAKTEDAELVELSTSGRHQRPVRGVSRSKSPEASSRQTRNTRGAKGLKQPVTEVIEEAAHESSFQPEEEKLDEVDAQADEVDEVVEDSAPEAPAQQSEGDEEPAPVQGDIPMDDPDDAAPQEGADDDDDDKPLTRRTTRSSRHSISGPAAGGNGEEDDEGEEEDDINPRPRRTRLLRKTSSRAKKQDDEVSDFDPNDSGDGEGSDNAAEGDNDDGGDSSERPSRGRRAATRGKRPREEEMGDDEAMLDPDELAEEAEDLKRSSRSQSRRTRQRRQSTPIAYEERRTRRRPAVGAFAIAVPAEQIEQEEEEDAPPPASQRRQRGGGPTKWQRNLNSTFGPFGGAGGLGSLLGGPWGTGAAAAAGGADSDSSDDEIGAGSGLIGGATGMTPTAAHGPGLLGAGGGDAEKLGFGATPNVGKIKDRKALADADPLGVDMHVDFSKVGGLSDHINQLKEMVQLPLLYPELFLRFKLTPPRGVLFHGPPGTGKTLLARALANSIGSGGRKITFYMRKGADALSKWVGEAERQLRQLFDEARKTQPSIIFFDEIDGLAPVRSSKQDQIHASIVSTLLALMDGMDGRGQVIVIGATNRPDSVDPALRRPGRFDREFYFGLPDVDARKSIIDINTKEWGLTDGFKRNLAENTKGYGGADLRALCTEAALNAIQRTFPQIYSSEQKLVVDPGKIIIHATDFMRSIKNMTPSSERSASSGAAPLPKNVAPLLRDQFDKIVEVLKNILPVNPKVTALEEAMYEPYEDSDHGFGRENLQQDFDRSRVFRPRLLITGSQGMGQHYMASAILHYFERVHVQSFDLGVLLHDGRPVEQVIVSMFIEVKRHKPSVIYIPNVDNWSSALGAAAMTSLVNMLKTVPPTDPILVLATAECEENRIDGEILKNLFGYSKKNRIEIVRPNADKRTEYFRTLVSYIQKSPTDFPEPHTRKRRLLEELPLAPLPPPKPRSKEEIRTERKRDMTQLNVLKLKLQPIMDMIKKSYRSFHVPVIPPERLEYLYQDADPNFISADVVQHRPFAVSKDKDGTDGLLEIDTGKFYYNLDTRVIEERISNGFYARPKDFYKDIRGLVHDIKNTENRDKIVKANEMLSNVDVDVTGIENETGTATWEALYQRQVQRTVEEAERAKKKAVMQAAAEATARRDQPDVEMTFQSAINDQEEDDGPVRIGAPVGPDAGRTLARFRPVSPEGNDQPAEPPVTNGDSVPSRPFQSGSDETQTTQPLSQMGPPQLPRPGNSQSVTSSVRATTGGTQEQPISQVSAMTSLPPGMSPSALLNEASTTNDPSTGHRSTGNWSTQATNGFHPDMENASQQLPDTQPPGSHPSGPSQYTSSSNSPWRHSQAEALAHGRLSNIGYSGNPQTSPTSSQAPTEQRASRMGLPNLLNDTGNGDNLSIRNSGVSATTSSSQLPIVHEEEIRGFQLDMVSRTSGCTIEQLEQISRELMVAIWASKHEWNRMKVLNQLLMVFNETMADIEDVQDVGQLSQDTNAVRVLDLYGSG